MITTDVPGYGTVVLEYLVLDVNGTLALDGELLEGIAERVRELSTKLKVTLLTADTYGKARGVAEALGAGMHRIAPPGEQQAKEAFVRNLGPERVVAIGNGANDVAMLRAARLGIAVVGPEGAWRETVEAADVVVADIRHALDLLIHPKRLVATLRR